MRGEVPCSLQPQARVPAPHRNGYRESFLRRGDQGAGAAVMREIICDFVSIAEERLPLGAAAEKEEKHFIIHHRHWLCAALLFFFFFSSSRSEHCLLFFFTFPSELLRLQWSFFRCVSLINHVCLDTHTHTHHFRGNRGVLSVCLSVILRIMSCLSLCCLSVSRFVYV